MARIKLDAYQICVLSFEPMLEQSIWTMFVQITRLLIFPEADRIPKRSKIQKINLQENLLFRRSQLVASTFENWILFQFEYPSNNNSTWNVYLALPDKTQS